MPRSLVPVRIALAAALTCAPAVSWAGRNADETQAFVARALTHLHDVGRDKAFADFSRPDGGFVDGELYMFCYTTKGVNLAHGANPAFVGKDLLNLKDPDGKLVNQEIIATALEKSNGWVDFRWPNPLTKKIEAKSAYVVKVDADTVCGSGYYKG